MQMQIDLIENLSHQICPVGHERSGHGTMDGATAGEKTVLLKFLRCLPGLFVRQLAGFVHGFPEVDHHLVGRIGGRDFLGQIMLLQDLCDTDMGTKFAPG